MSSTVIVLDNGGATIKLGIGGERDPTTISPNCTACSTTTKKTLIADETLSIDPTFLTLRRPVDRGYLTNPDLQRDIWAHLFKTLSPIPFLLSHLFSSPLPHFALPRFAVPSSISFLRISGFGLCLFLTRLRWFTFMRLVGTLMGLFLGHNVAWLLIVGLVLHMFRPLFRILRLIMGLRGLIWAGKALTNYLKELVSYRAVNVMDETLIVDHVKENLCFVSLDVARDLQVARKSGKDNLFKCTYVLPDGITHSKGFVKDVNEAQRYHSLYDGVPDSHMSEKDVSDVEDDEEKTDNRKKIDLTKNEFNFKNERFLVPEMIFHPADLGMNEAGLAECIVRSVNSCHPLLHPVLYESIILTGGSTLFPHFAKRLEKELRPLVPDDYQVKITTQEDPILGIWRGGSLLASSPDFETTCVIKFEYEEEGSARCSKRFFQ